MTIIIMIPELEWLNLISLMHYFSFLFSLFLNLAAPMAPLNSKKYNKQIDGALRMRNGLF